ncbi:uncharacterized protein LOC132745909 isoform X2 [Ruditapes philippinarum]|uniref:uncharacterized protein LOC132745909 isoform X2 n=1 Tax=Ruditapes philippinarum TaxID=129788 RepID=UPI00295A6C46|nr:uncharacterized protein LOC132745909 isoform X2 [Ruditapes philippinarum]
MDEQDVEIFLNNLTLKLNVYCFDYLASIPLPFTDLAKVNRVSDKEAVRSLGLPTGYGKPLKEFLKPIKIDFNDKNIKKALKHLNSFLEEENLDKLRKVLQLSREECELEIGLGVHLFSKLMGEAYTSREKNLERCPCGCQEKLLDLQYMWIGSESTWYGELDIIAGNLVTGDSVSVLVKNRSRSGNSDIQKGDEVDSEGDESEEENDNATELSDSDQSEVKYYEHAEALNHVIAQAVVFAFTEYNRHASKGKVIPSIYIDKSCFQYVMYCPVDDIMLVSNYMTYMDMENFDKKSGFRPFIVLWIILNHRLFFKKSPDLSKRFIKSGFHEKINDLQQFQNLAAYSKIIRLPEQKLNFPNDTPNTIGSTAMDWFLDK